MRPRALDASAPPRVVASVHLRMHGPGKVLEGLHDHDIVIILYVILLYNVIVTILTNVQHVKIKHNYLCI